MRVRLALPLSLLLLAAVPAAASAATTIGQAPPPGSGIPCNSNAAFVQGMFAAGSNYQVPAGGGVITQWNHQGGASGGTLALGIYVAGPNNTEYSPVAESAVETPAAGANTFATRIPVAGGEFIGVHEVTGGANCWYSTGAAGDTVYSATPAPAVGSGNTMYGNAVGQFRVNVAAVIEPDGDKDGYGDETQDGCPGNATRQDDCIAPEVTIDSKPDKKTTKTKAKFKFSANDPSATFECKLDNGGFKDCNGGKVKYKHLKPKKHTFSVRATDANKNTSDVVSYKWKLKPKR